MSTPTLNILFLPKWYPFAGDPFDGNFVENHAHAIKRICRLTVLFVHSEEREGSELYRFEEKDNEGIRELRVYFKKATSPFSLVNKLINIQRYKVAQKLGYKKLYPSSSPDLIHIHVLARSSFLALDLLRDNIPFVITEHWSGYLPESGALKKSGKAAWYKRIGMKANAIHTVTQHLATAMRSHGIENKYTVIPNVVKEDLFIPQKNSTSEKIKMLYVGNILQHPKRILDSIEAIAEIASLRKDFTLDIYGEGADLKSMQELIKTKGLEKIVGYKGTADRAGIAKAMGQADLLFLNSEFENQPCVINEALCCGTPVVVPDIEGIKEFMQDEFGLLFKRLDQDDFKAKLNDMLNNLGQYDSDLIRKLAVERFGEEAIAQEFITFYKEALRS